MLRPDEDGTLSFFAVKKLVPHPERVSREKKSKISRLDNGNIKRPMEGKSLVRASPRSSLIGKSKAVAHIRTLIDRVKDLDAPVLIYGESGTGKELIARSIHEEGARRLGRFVAVNCGAIPDHLLESELFGHSRGSFTGAIKDKAGLIEEANGGTFFLDEVGDLTFPLQAKLLRLLQEKEIRRIGENRMRPVDVRFISATNKHLEREIERGNFREDLYYRLRIITIEVPPLRERPDDLLLLLNFFAEKYGREMKKERPYFSPGALDLLSRYAWPGNVRELQNEIQRCLILGGEDRCIREEHLSPKINPREETSGGRECNFFEAKADFVRRYLNQALERCHYNKAKTAEKIGLSRQGLFKLMKKHKIDKSDDGDTPPDANEKK
jgi:transcriptional regulator with PAS, ATPase and Fis domain